MNANTLAWLDQIDSAIMAMNGRPLSSKQRSAVIGVLLTLDQTSPFYSARQFTPKQQPADLGARGGSK